jgi:hypothetical protein
MTEPAAKMLVWIGGRRVEFTDFCRANYLIPAKQVTIFAPEDLQKLRGRRLEDCEIYWARPRDSFHPSFTAAIEDAIDGMRTRT